MSTTQETFDVPDKEPWKDENTLYGLYHGDGLNQTEIAEYFTEEGHEVAPSTISDWMGKLEIDTTKTKHDNSSREEPSLECEYFEVCGNETGVPRNLVCRDCMEIVQKRKRDGYTNAVALEGDDFTTMLEHIERLYEQYS